MWLEKSTPHTGGDPWSGATLSPTGDPYMVFLSFFLVFPVCFPRSSWYAPSSLVLQRLGLVSEVG